MRFILRELWVNYFKCVKTRYVVPIFRRAIAVQVVLAARSVTPFLVSAAAVPGILDRNVIDVHLAILTFPRVLRASATFAEQWMLTVRTACVLAMQLLDSALVR